MERALTEYIVLCGQIVGNSDCGFETIYGFNGERFATREKAISEGFKIWESDDFNVGVVKDGKLVSLDWMEEKCDDDPTLMAEIAEKICL